MSTARVLAVGGFSRAPAGGARHQRGVALVVALVVLLILTILGVSALVSTALEGLMAGNVQEQNRAHQAAETGIEAALARAGDYSAVIGTPTTGSATVIGGSIASGGYNASANYSVTFQGQTDTPRDSRVSGQGVRVNRYMITSVGTTANNGATVTLTRGISQKAPAAGR